MLVMGSDAQNGLSTTVTNMAIHAGIAAVDGTETLEFSERVRQRRSLQSEHLPVHAIPFARLTRLEMPKRMRRAFAENSLESHPTTVHRTRFPDHSSRLPAGRGGQDEAERQEP
jgi:hypothetical protein